MLTLEERIAAANKEIEALLVLYGEEEERITAELKQTGKYKLGLDSNSQVYAPLNKEFDKHMAEVFKKYDLPPGTKIKLE